MSDIEKGLHAHHSALSSSSAGFGDAISSSSSSSANANRPPPIVEASFAVVDSVSANSPAEAAGLKVRIVHGHLSRLLKTCRTNTAFN